jgi:hypothetical protein
MPRLGLFEETVGSRKTRQIWKRLGDMKNILRGWPDQDTAKELIAWGNVSFR